MWEFEFFETLQFINMKNAAAFSLFPSQQQQQQQQQKQQQQQEQQQHQSVAKWRSQMSPLCRRIF
jgi:hypothetical protein